MIVTRKLSEVPIMDTAHNVDARNLYSTEDAMVTVIRLKPGQSLKKHITPVDVAFYVMEGEGVVLIGEEREQEREQVSRYSCRESKGYCPLLV